MSNKLAYIRLNPIVLAQNPDLTRHLVAFGTILSASNPVLTDKRGEAQGIAPNVVRQHGLHNDRFDVRGENDEVKNSFAVFEISPTPWPVPKPETTESDVEGIFNADAENGGETDVFNARASSGAPEEPGADVDPSDDELPPAPKTDAAPKASKRGRRSGTADDAPDSAQ